MKSPAAKQRFNCYRLALMIIIAFVILVFVCPMLWEMFYRPGAMGWGG